MTTSASRGGVPAAGLGSGLGFWPDIFLLFLFSRLPRSYIIPNPGRIVQSSKSGDKAPAVLQNIHKNTSVTDMKNTKPMHSPRAYVRPARFRRKYDSCSNSRRAVPLGITASSIEDPAGRRSLTSREAFPNSRSDKCSDFAQICGILRRGYDRFRCCH